jgi:hypothetical protein
MDLRPVSVFIGISQINALFWLQFGATGPGGLVTIFSYMHKGRCVLLFSHQAKQNVVYATPNCRQYCQKSKCLTQNAFTNHLNHPFLPKKQDQFKSTQTYETQNS